MRRSRNTLVVRMPGRGEALVVQPLTGRAALVGEREAAAIEGLGDGSPLPETLCEATLLEAGFAVASDEEELALRERAWAEWSAEAARTPAQLVAVPTFGCNLSCVYCDEKAFGPQARGLVAPEAVDAFFAFVDRRHAGDSPRPLLTLFGGEPLVDTPAHHDRLRRYLEGARARDMAVATVTNGFDLESFVPALADGPVEEVRVAIDGPAAVHDARRPHGSGRGTFDRIVRGVDALVAAKVPVSLRVAADRENLPALPDLAALAEAKGWLDLPGSRFRAQVGRNHALLGCASRRARGALLGRVELWAEYAKLAEAHPVLRRFHAPPFHGVRDLAETGELPRPCFDACPAAKKQWAFAPDGGLYGCTATVGNPRYLLGRYHPEIVLDEAAVAPWRDRSTATIPGCARCDVAPICGGGCGAVSDAEGRGIGGQDCLPVKELIGIGARLYGLADRV